MRRTGDDVANLGGRVIRLEAAARARRAALDPSPGLMFLMPDLWPAEDRAAFEAAEARGDEGGRRDVIERATGTRPGPRTLTIVVSERPNGPQ